MHYPNTFPPQYFFSVLSSVLGLYDCPSDNNCYSTNICIDQQFPQILPLSSKLSFCRKSLFQNYCCQTTKIKPSSPMSIARAQTSESLPTSEMRAVIQIGLVLQSMRPPFPWMEKQLTNESVVVVRIRLTSSSYATSYLAISTKKALMEKRLQKWRQTEMISKPFYKFL